MRRGDGSRDLWTGLHFDLGVFQLTFMGYL